MAKSKYISCTTAEKSENTGHGNYRHGLYLTREYVCWREAKARCNNPGHQAYARYGGRGIKMSADWQSDFMTFLADMGPCNGLTLDRLNNDGNYEKGNCEWRTWKHQNRNHSGNRMIEYRGERITVTELAERFDFNEGMFRHYYQRHLHLDIEDIIQTFPLRRRCIRKA